MGKPKGLALILMLTAGIAAAVNAEEAQTEAPAVLEIGTASADNDFEVLLKNRSGHQIVSVAVQVNENEMGENLLPDGAVFEDEQDGKLVFTPYSGDAAGIPVYNIELTFDDDLTSILHTFPFGDADAVTIRRGQISKDQLDDEEAEGDVEIAYITFTSRFLGTEQDTKWHEWNLIAPEKAGEAAAAYAAKIAAEQSYSGGYSGNGGSGLGSSGSSGGSSGGSDDWCLDDGLIF